MHIRTEGKYNVLKVTNYKQIILYNTFLFKQLRVLQLILASNTGCSTYLFYYLKIVHSSYSSHSSCFVSCFFLNLCSNATLLPVMQYIYIFSCYTKTISFNLGHRPRTFNIHNCLTAKCLVKHIFMRSKLPLISQHDHCLASKTWNTTIWWRSQFINNNNLKYSNNMSMLINMKINYTIIFILEYSQIKLCHYSWSVQIVNVLT